jgi:TetR/AcrR family transcriptional repressor of nem operon
MGRPRSFDEPTAVAGAATLFAAHGYDGTSVDDLVRGLGMHRGSLYQAFGSKRALYLRVLREHVEDLGRTTPTDLTLLLRAAVERAPVDTEAAALVREGLARLADQLPDAPGTDPSTALAQLIGELVIHRATAPTALEERP